MLAGNLSEKRLTIGIHSTPSCYWRGERNPHTPAALRDRRIKAIADTIVRALVGDYRREHLSTLRQSLAAFRHYQELPRVNRGLRWRNCTIAAGIRVETGSDTPGSTSLSEDKSKPKTSEPGFDLRTDLHRIFGVDLTQAPGIHVVTTQTLLAEYRS